MAIKQGVSRRFFIKAICAFLLSLLVSILPALRAYASAFLKFRTYLEDPEFYIKNNLLAYQFAEDEYPSSVAYRLKQNSCGSACIASLIRIVSYLVYGIKDTSITIGSVIERLKNLTFDFEGQQFPFIVSNGQMYFAGIKSALERLLPAQFCTSEYLKPPSVTEKTLVSKAQLADFYRTASLACAFGAILVVFCMKYNSGHIILVADVKHDGSGIFLDPYTGEVLRSSFAEFCAPILVRNQEELGLQLGLISALAVFPNQDAVFQKPFPKRD